jgi:hypothetical protein
MGRRWVRIVLGVALVLAMGACDSSGSETTTTTSRPEPVSLEVRPVVVMGPVGPGEAVGAGPGYDLLPPATTNTSPGFADLRYGVGPVAMTERDVRGARARRFPLQGWVVDLTLTRGGVRALDRLARDLYPEQPPQNSIAIVVDGKVVSAPVFQQNHYSGDQLQIGGGLDARHAKALAASLNA